MAISTQKFLPGSKGVTKPVSQEKISSITLTSPDKKNVNTIRVRTIQIEHLLKGTLAADKKRLGDKKKDANTKRKEDLETNLEKKPDPKKKFTMPKILPRTGILDWIKNFITNIILGYFAVRLVENLPALAGLFKGIVAVGEFIIDWGGRILNGLVTFVDWGYKLYDGLRQFTGDIFGESSLKKFDAFMKGLNTFLNAVFFLGLAIVRVAPKFLGKGGKGGRVGIQGTRGQAGRTTRGGTSSAAARRYTDKFGKRAAFKKFGKEGVQSLGGRYGRSGVTNLARKGVVKVLGKGGVKSAARILKPIVKNIPIIGGLLEFAISWASGDPIGKAAFRGIGAGLGTWIGGALGTLVGGPIGTGIGMFIGGAGGSELGGVMYDTFFGGKKSPPKKGYAKGGRVKKASRTFRPRIKRRSKIRKAPYIPPVKIDPGKDTGGEKKLEESPWWNPFGLGVGEEKKDEVNLLDYFKEYGDKFGKMGYFGPMATLGIKALLGQKPSDKEYSDAALGLSALTAANALGFAAGGKVDKASLQQDFIKKELKKSFSPIVDEVINDIQKNLGKAKPKEEGGKKNKNEQSSVDSPTGARHGYTSGTAGGRWGPVLDLIRKYEGSGYDSAWPSTTKVAWDRKQGVKNPKPLTELTIGEADAWQERTYKARSRGTILSAAAGAYQFMYIKNMAKKYAGLGPDEPFSAENQDKMAIGLIENKQGITLDMLKNNPAEAQRLLSGEWASLPKDSSNRGSYAGQGGHVKSSEVRESFKQVLGGGSGERTIEKITGTEASNMGASSGSALAGELGNYLKTNLRQGPDFQAVTEHSQHGGVRGKHAVGSYHDSDRAIDIGAYAHEQPKILSAIANFNKLKGISPVELLHAGNRSDHSDHVHVAYHKGGEVYGSGERWAKLLGGEIVVDVDSAGPAKDLLLAINQASGRDGVMKAIRDYAPYESLQSRMIPVPVERTVPVPIPSSSGGGVVVIGGGGGSDPFSSLALNA